LQKKKFKHEDNLNPIPAVQSFCSQGKTNGYEISLLRHIGCVRNHPLYP